MLNGGTYRSTIIDIFVAAHHGIDENTIWLQRVDTHKSPGSLLDSVLDY